MEPVAEVGGAGNLVARYVYGTRGHVPDYVVTDDGDSTYRIVVDHLGSVRLVVNVASGWVAQRMDYDGYGRATLDTNPGFQSFGYAGGLWDEGTGRVRFGARDYDASVGRWTSKDPSGFRSRGSNLYSYVGNAPPRGIDPTGRDYWIEGPSGPYEPAGHYSIAVGDPNGDYESYSFGTPDGPLAALLGLAEGSVYLDKDKAGNIVEGTYNKTTLAEDRAILNWLRGWRYERWRYSVFNSSCRTFSMERLNELMLQGFGVPAPSPRPYDPTLKSSDPPFGSKTTVK